jgi:type VI secretion system secreted protein VgrG
LTPVAGGAYRAVFSDGTSKDGTLDGKGFARLENIPPGPVQVYFGEDPRPYVPPTVEDAGTVKLSTVEEDLIKLGYDIHADDIDYLLATLAGRNLQ